MDALTERVLALRSTAAAASLRRAGVETTEHYAYPHLAWSWSAGASWSRVPTLRFAALAASFPAVPHLPGVSLGEVLARDVRSSGVSEAGVVRRLGVVTSGDVEQLHRIVRGLLSASRTAGKGLDWDLVRRMYFGWDLPDITHRRRVRLRLLEDFYQQLEVSASSEPTGTIADVARTITNDEGGPAAAPKEEQ
jgi:CRISPR type I-E-associated protein CasB/Cse2